MYISFSKVWLCLGLTLVFLTYIIPRLSELKRIYVTKSKETIDGDHSSDQIGREPVIDFSMSTSRNGMYILALLTYQGKYCLLALLLVISHLI